MLQLQLYNVQTFKLLIESYKIYKKYDTDCQDKGERESTGGLVS